MKKVLTHLTGIVFVITMLVAGSCKRDTQPKVKPIAENGIQQERDPKVTISLKAIYVEEEVHLEMSDSKKPKCTVIDGLVTVVFPGDTVIWKKGSNIQSIDSINLHIDYGFSRNFFTVDDSLIALQIPSTEIDDSIIKYDIKFTLKKDGGTHTIDPYLRIKGTK